MRLIDLQKLSSIDETIIDLQSKLSNLYEQRKAIIAGYAHPQQHEGNVDFSAIDLSVTPHKQMKLRSQKS